MPSNVYTNLALGNCMETLLNTSTSIVMPPLTPRGSNSSFHAFHHPSPSDSMAQSSHKCVDTLKRQESGGIPIPSSPRHGAAAAAAAGPQVAGFMMTKNSPPSGRYSSQSNNHLYGSPGSSPVHTIHTAPTSGTNYLDVYGGGGGIGGVVAGSYTAGTSPISRAASPNPSMSAPPSHGCGVAAGIGENRLGNNQKKKTKFMF